MPPTKPVDLPHWTVNETLLAAPAAAAILNRFGIDTCCGGTQTLAEAACSVGLAPDILVAALEHTLRAAE
jgi:regulator of cell morphogenesis and NO signaling